MENKNEYLFLYYPKCSTCMKAKKFLEMHNIKFIERNIVESRPTSEELTVWHRKSDYELKKFFNTSGMLYKEMNLKDKLKEMSEEEIIDILASSGMLVKRPVLIGKGVLLLGFKEEEWKTLI